MDAHPDFQRWADYLSHARNGHSRPLANNTCVHWSGKDAIAFQLHSTDVVTLHRDGARSLAACGWQTVTTASRIREYGSQYVHGWAVRCEPDPLDPHPLGVGSRGNARRTIAKPYYAPDPGPEPIKDEQGCIAGSDESYEAQEDVPVYHWHADPPPGAFMIRHAYSDGSGADQLWHRRSSNEIISWSDEAHSWYRRDEIPRAGEHKECPHCKEFRLRHEQWDRAFRGNRYGRGARKGYELMRDSLEKYGSREAWQAAYITEFREVRALNHEIAAWSERNVISFYDGITVGPNGLCSLADKRAHCDQLRQHERAMQRQAKLDATETRRRARLHASIERKRAPILARQAKQRAREREVKTMIAQALAESMFCTTELMRKESFIH